MNDDKMRFWVLKHKLKNSPYSDMEAIEALQLFAEAGEPIPKELLPYLEQSCSAWRDTHRRQIRSESRPLYWSGLVWDVQLLRRQGTSLREAIDLVAKWNDEKVSTLKREYTGTKNKAAKEDADMIYDSTSQW